MRHFLYFDCISALSFGVNAKRMRLKKLKRRISGEANKFKTFYIKGRFRKLSHDDNAITEIARKKDIL